MGHLSGAGVRLPLLTQLGSDVLGHSTDLPMGSRELVLRNSPSLHPKLDRFALREVEAILIDKGLSLRPAMEGPVGLLTRC
jgi:hypothetical protein